MTTLTIDMMRDAMRKVGTPPPCQEIKCGNLDEFVAAIERKTGKAVHKVSNSSGVFSGIEVKVSPLIPTDKAVVLVDGEIKSIIDLREG
jgi:hypothetical protein